ncbi:hypothetical protein HJG60_010639 [Phyllostomus discolor]|uniref:Uncharacterized protein n=1 Tax=Phyllostomus discolor TaxID=89673 RepID=A0A834ALQ3_9CHIR|nr:hypothetical protein HJG60_010639 [Phyllostomus discolor]
MKLEGSLPGRVAGTFGFPSLDLSCLSLSGGGGCRCSTSQSGQDVLLLLLLLLPALDSPRQQWFSSLHNWIKFNGVNWSLKLPVEDFLYSSSKRDNTKIYKQESVFLTSQSKENHQQNEKTTH